MVTLCKDTGDGHGFVPAAGEHVDVTLTPTNGASVLNPTGTCLNAGANTDANGQCSITFTSNTTGKVTGARDLDARRSARRRRRSRSRPTVCS